MDAITFSSPVRKMVPAPPRQPRRFNRTRWEKRIATAFMLATALWMARDVVLPPPTTNSSVMVQVEEGDTLWALAQRYGDPNEYILRRVSRLQEVNGMTNGEVLRAGQTLIVPTSQPALSERMIASR